jgi:hypothetical protein
MSDSQDRVEFETRYEWLRPGQLIARREQCPLVIVPVAPLEYHGPHLPIGTDPINCGMVAHACCRKLGKGVVLPTIMTGTERERGPAIVESLGFAEGEFIVGMDFPSWRRNFACSSDKDIDISLSRTGMERRTTSRSSIACARS